MIKENNPLRFYVYAYLRSKDSSTAKAGTPYYIGKGQGRRFLERHGKLPVPKDKKYIIFLEQKLSGVGALALERRYISWYGRVDNNSGILRNLTDGGEGTSGKTYEYEERAGIKNPFYGKSHSKETVSRISLSKRGTVVTKEQIEKIRKANTGKKRTKEQNEARSILFKEICNIKLECPHCGKIGGATAMKRHHFNNCSIFTGIIKNKAKGRLQCPHCNKVGGSRWMNFRHFDNCELRTEVIET